MIEQITDDRLVMGFMVEPVYGPNPTGSIPQACPHLGSPPRPRPPATSRLTCSTREQSPFKKPPPLTGKVVSPSSLHYADPPGAPPTPPPHFRPPSPPRYRSQLSLRFWCPPWAFASTVRLDSSCHFSLGFYYQVRFLLPLLSRVLELPVKAKLKGLEKVIIFIFFLI